jgi:hypothetical protein
VAKRTGPEQRRFGPAFRDGLLTDLARLGRAIPVGIA